jgi:hypothetical protein
MMCKTKYRPYFILLLMSMFGAATAPAQQDYRYQAPIPQVSVAGFYKISLPEELISRCAFEGNRPRDIRLFSRSGSIVPYIFEMDQPILQDNSFTVLPTIDSLVDDKSRLSVVVQNTGMLMRDALVLVIRNTEVCQSITLSGSDDNKRWFVIREHVPLNCHFKATEGQFIQTITMPPSRYAFFRVTTEGENKLPVNIRKIGVWNTASPPVTPVYTTLPTPYLQQQDSTDGQSYILAAFPRVCQIDQLKLEFTGSRFYKREMTIRTRQGSGWQIAGPMVLQTGTSNRYPFSGITDSIWIVIQNGDNPPLKCTGVIGETIPRYLLAYLDADTVYHLHVGNAGAKLPRYDLDFFYDSAGVRIGTLSLGAVTDKGSVNRTTEATEHKSRWLIWLALGAALGVLLFFTFAMLRKIGAASDDDLPDA